MIIPAPVYITRAAVIAPHVAALGIDFWLLALLEAGFKLKRDFLRKSYQSTVFK